MPCAVLVLIGLVACQGGGPPSHFTGLIPSDVTAGLGSGSGQVEAREAAVGIAPELLRASIEQGVASELASDPKGWTPTDEVQGQAVDTIRRFYPGGRLRRIQTQLPGVLGPSGHHGRDLGLHANGAWSREAFWTGGQLDGSYKEWFEGGQLHVLTSFAAGLRDGTYQEYDDMGALRVEAHYRAGLLQGELRMWFETGERQELSHWDGGQQVGLGRVWNRENIAVSKEEFANGKRHGTSVVFHRIPGEERIHLTGTYQSGRKEGVWVEYNPAGEKVQEKEFVEGRVTGFLREFRGGIMTLETHYVNNVEQGARLEFYADGKPFSRGMLENGARVGIWTYWEEDGALQSGWSGWYEAGQKVRDLTDEEASREGQDE